MLVCGMALGYADESARQSPSDAARAGGGVHRCRPAWRHEGRRTSPWRLTLGQAPTGARRLVGRSHQHGAGRFVAGGIDQDHGAEHATVCSNGAGRLCSSSSTWPMAFWGELVGIPLGQVWDVELV